MWCSLCRRQARTALNELDRLVTWLEQSADGFAARAPGSFVSGGSVEPPSPAPLIDISDKVFADLRSMEAQWRRQQGYVSSRRTSVGRTAHDRAITIAFLASHLDGILLDRKMIKEIRLIIKWSTVLRRLAHAEPERVDRPGRCPRCHMVSVLYSPGDIHVIRCRACPIELTVDQYEAEVLAVADPGLVPEARRQAGLADE